MRKHTACLLLFGVLLAPRTVAQWVQLPGIEGGTPTAFLASGVNMFATTLSGYIYASNDNGANWSRSYAGDGRRLTCLVQTGSAVLAGGWNGIVRSTDGGMSWAKSDSGLLPEPRVMSLLSYDTLLYATTEKGPSPDRGSIYVSSDTGRHWTVIFSAAGGNAWRQVSAIARKGNVLCAGSDSLFRSTDGGSTWKSVLGTPEMCTSLIADSSRFYAGTNFRHVYCSTDNGDSWVLQYAFPNSGASSSSIFHLTIQNGVLYAGDDENPGLYRSTDQGVTWTGMEVLKRNLSNGSITYNTCTALYPTSGSLYAGTQLGGIFRSTDEGHSWIESNRGFHDVDVPTLAVENQSVYAATGVGFFRSDDNGDSWISILPEEGQDFSSIVTMGQTIVASSFYGLYRSEDRGLTWTLSSDLRGEGGSLSVLNGKLYAVGKANGVHVSLDSGKTWLPSNNGLTDLNTLSFAGQGSKFVVGTRFGGFYFSTDAGSSWTQIDGYQNQFFAGRMACMKEDVFAQTNVGFLHSTNDGAAWVHIDNEPGTVIGFHVRDSMLFVATNVGVALSMDKGATWKYCYTSSSLPGSSGSVPLASNDQYLFIGEKGIVRVPLANLVTGVPVPDKVEMPTTIVLMQNYPNPFNPETGVRFQVSGESDVKLVVYDMLGREVAVLVNERKAPGTYTVQFDGSRLASGVYIYRLTARQTDGGQAGSFVQSRKMILLR